MSKYAALTLLLVLCSCTHDEPKYYPIIGKDGHNALVSQASASLAQCPNGGIVVNYGLDLNDNNILDASEVQGTTVVCDGLQGSPGTSVVFTTIAASDVQCPSGGTVLLLASDSLGTGSYSSLDEHQQSVTVCNGTTPQYSVVTPIQPCGAASSPFKEVLLCLEDGEILSDFSETMSGQDTRLSFIPNGTYVDTDESKCNFTVASNAHGDHIVSWASGSNSYSTWNASSVTCKVH